MANGCTSGHGVCGIPRLSIRSLVSVISFMTSAILFATLKHFYPSYFDYMPPLSLSDNQPSYFFICSYLLIYLIVTGISWSKSKQQVKNNVLAIIAGLIFGMGLILSGMARRSKIMGFLIISR